MILFDNVTKKYRGTQKPALDGVSMRVDRGEFVFVVGASGSGKSSCLRLILREDQASSGDVHVLGQDLSKISSRKVPYFRRNLGTVFQDFRLLQNKTVYDNVAFSLQVIGKSRGFIQEAVPDTLEMVGLANKAKRYPHELSGGEQQRVAIARSIVNKPSILLADEPTGNLDPATSLGIMQLLRAINAAGTTVVMATHEAAFVDIMQQRVVELSQGVVVRDEIGGGYGKTASIPVTELTEEGARVLRTTEAVVRQALAPEQVELGEAAGTAEVAESAGAEAPAEATAEVAASVDAESDEDTVAVTSGPAQPVSAVEELYVDDEPEPSTSDKLASLFEEPNPLGDEDLDEGDTVRSEDGPLAPKIPDFLDPGLPAERREDPPQSVAEQLGLHDRGDTEVGPSR